MLRLFKHATQHPERPAIGDCGRWYTYSDLLHASAQLATQWLAGQSDLAEARVAFMVGPGFDYVRTQWAIWRAGGVAVPLCITHPLPALQYVLADTQPTLVVVEPTYAAQIATLTAAMGVRLWVLTPFEGEIAQKMPLPRIDPHRRAMILYTSGTTHLPKGVVTTHQNIEAQISALVQAWEWTADDHILCVLPLHHIHGIVNVVGCALWSGARCTFLPHFAADTVLDFFRNGQLTLFMAVPTIYYKLVSAIDALLPDQQANLRTQMQSLRLMVSGSAALPVSVMERWEALSGHRLLERYGMTEVGMAISNPYSGERRAGYIGKALPGVQVRLMDDQQQAVTNGEAGEIQLRGHNVFLEYWGKPDATAQAFTDDGWFRTGDVAVIEHGYYRILGRASMDILKSGGYKISALEIEEVLRNHPAVADCSVVGVPDEEWGEIVAVAFVTKTGKVEQADLQTWLRERLPPYKVPRRYQAVSDLPRNAMGKVTKNDVKKFFLL